MINAHPLALGLVPPPVEQTGIELLGDDGVLDRSREPIHEGHDRLQVHVRADLAASLPPFDELERSVRILADEPPVDVPPQLQVGAVVADQDDPV